MLSPTKTKYRKAFKGRIHGSAKGGFSLNFGSYGLKTMEPERITARQIEAARRAITRQMKRQGRVWIRVFPDLPVTGKPAEVRMGKGKGAVDHWAARVAPGRIMFEIDGVPDDVAREALRLGAAKLPVKTRIVSSCSSWERLCHDWMSLLSGTFSGSQKLLTSRFQTSRSFSSGMRFQLMAWTSASSAASAHRRPFPAGSRVRLA